MGTLFFAIAVLHTFSCSFFKKLGSKYPEGSVAENFFHLIGEIEVVFGLWAGIFFLFLALTTSLPSTIEAFESLSFTEPLFVFAILCIASTKPILDLAEATIFKIAKVIPYKKSVSTYFLCLFLGSLLGSLITEPAAMTVTALLLRNYFLTEKVSEKFKYITIANLFVNISIGGVLTSFAAPPVVMVASKWSWSSAFMFQHFGYKALVAVFLNSLIATAFNLKELKKISLLQEKNKIKVPLWIKALNLFFLFSVVAMSHHPIIFLGLFLFFMGVVHVTREFQSEVRIKEGLLVAFFLAGLVVLGSYQSWWLNEIFNRVDSHTLFFSTAALTAITDNAALTFLGAQIKDISVAFQYALVSGAVAGGGLTVIANAPNPAGFSILQDRFGDSGINAAKLFLNALLPTGIAMLAFLFL